MASRSLIGVELNREAIELATVFALMTTAGVNQEIIQRAFFTIPWQAAHLGEGFLWEITCSLHEQLVRFQVFSEQCPGLEMTPQSNLALVEITRGMGGCHRTRCDVLESSQHLDVLEFIGGEVTKDILG